MAEKTAISWTDSTFNPWLGCQTVSPGCDHCYAEAMLDRRLHLVQWGARQPRKRTSAANWKLPARWNARTFVKCAACSWRGELADFKSEPGWTMCPACSSADWQDARRRVFCASLGDWLDNEVPIEWLCDLLQVISTTRNLDWLLLTKRIGNWRGRLTAALALAALAEGRARWPGLGEWIADWLDKRPPANVWLGISVVNQAEADRDIIKLLRIPAARRFLSCEPLLEALRLWMLTKPDYEEDPLGAEVYPLRGLYAVPDCDWLGPKLDWVIAGGESGPNARCMHPDWVRSIRDQCARARVPFFFKQVGGSTPAAGGCELDGREEKAWPAPVSESAQPKEIDSCTP